MKIQHQLDNDFDCVDLYKQPSLQNPVLKNHKIQLYPTFANNIMQSKLSNRKIVEGCSVGKVPIYTRRKIQQNITNSSSRLETDDFQQYSKDSPGYHTVTLDTTRNVIFHGASAGIGAYNLSLQAKQYSISSIWLESGPPNELNSIKVGLGVHPSLYGDSQLRLTGHWTADNYGKTGCYNIVCPGFVQVNRDKDYAIGSVSHPTSAIGSTTKYIGYIKIKQDRITGHWWLIIQTTKPIYVGYWPKELFTHLSKGASLIRFGGQTYAPPNEDSPPMGSGRLPREKFINSGFMVLLKIFDSEYNEIDIKPEDMKRYTDANSNCYDLWYHGFEGYQYRQAFLYGGPGGRNCDI
ncbi:unnamed protein product [Lathyrus sativus]|nr:unnamed protein product [Lathyrus sativus]